MSWRNPLPVVCAVVTVGRGVLLVRRNSGLGTGKLALPGGYLESGETWQEGMARELREETGISVLPELFEPYYTASSTNLENVLVFGRTNLDSCNILNFRPNAEVSELSIVEKPIELAFLTHTKVLEKAFAEMASGEQFREIVKAAKTVDKEFYHKHTDFCYGVSEPLCVEHHAHREDCWGRRLHCRKTVSSESINRMHDLIQN